jgi:nicotinamidase/pyrazinamidase
MRDPITEEVTQTELADLLHQREIKRVVVVGLALDYCVKATALDSRAEGWHTSVPLHLTAAVNLEPDDGTEAAGALRLADITVS